MAVARTIAPDSTVYADEASYWDQLAANFPIKRINHNIAYSEDGACTNQAESFFSGCAGPRSAFTTASAAAISRLTLAKWRGANMPADQQRQPIYESVTADALHQSRSWCGYWQRRSGLTLGS